MEPISMGLMLALMGAGSALKGGSQIFQGIKDKREGQAIEEAAGDRPEYEIPESVDKMIEMYRQMSQTGLPGEDIMKQDIQSQTARTAGTAGQLADSSVGALTALGGAQQREAQALRDLQVRSAQYRQQNQQNYAQAVGSRSQYEQEQWRQNQLLPWEIDMNRAMQLQTQGRGNIMGGIDSIGSGMVQAGSAYGTAQIYKNMYPNVNDTGADQLPVIPRPPATPADTQSYQNMFQGALPPMQIPNYGWPQ